jgi:hypothetical protein
MAKKTDEAQPAVDKSFLDTLLQHNRGNSLNKAAAGLRQVIAATQVTAKPGEVHLIIKVIPASQNNAHRVDFITRVKTKIPELDEPGSIFYVDDDFNLVREDPNQATLPLKTVADEAEKPLKKVDAK